MNSWLHSLALQVDPKHVCVYTCERVWRRGREWVLGPPHLTCHVAEQRKLWTVELRSPRAQLGGVIRADVKDTEHTWSGCFHVCSCPTSYFQIGHSWLWICGLSFQPQLKTEIPMGVRLINLVKTSSAHSQSFAGSLAEDRCGKIVSLSPKLISICVLMCSKVCICSLRPSDEGDRQ